MEEKPWERLARLKKEELDLIQRLRQVKDETRLAKIECLKLLEGYPDWLLTARETRILEMLRAEPTIHNKEIAARLSIEGQRNVSLRVVKFHISNLLSKYGVTSRMDLIYPKIEEKKE